MKTGRYFFGAAVTTRHEERCTFARVLFMYFLVHTYWGGSRCARVTAGLPPFSCSRCVITLFRKQSGCVSRIKNLGGKNRVPTSSEWMIHANTNQHYRLESNNQVIGLRVTLFGRKRLSCPARTANSCVRRYLLRRERDGYFRTEMCQVLRQEKATQVPHSLAHVALAFCGVIQVSGRLTVQFASNLSYRTMVYGPIGIITF